MNTVPKFKPVVATAQRPFAAVAKASRTRCVSGAAPNTECQPPKGEVRREELRREEVQSTEPDALDARQAAGSPTVATRDGWRRCRPKVVLLPGLTRGPVERQPVIRPSATRQLPGVAARSNSFSRSRFHHAFELFGACAMMIVFLVMALFA